MKLPLRFLFALWALCLTTAQADDRPNIVFAFADDMGRYASIYAEIDGPGTVNDTLQTPHMDHIAKEGTLFPNAFVNAPSCTPCRSSLLSGQYFYRTGHAAILQGAIWDLDIPSWPLLLENSGYHIGHTYKVWSPGTPVDAPHGAAETRYSKGGSKFNGFSQNTTRMMADEKSIQEAKQSLFDEVRTNFDSFLEAREEGEPFSYWFGPTNVHRKWIAGSGKELWGIDPDSLEGKMPEFLPDVPVVREDFADYLGEVMAFDAGLGVLLERLEELGELEKTIVVVSGDHGAPGFPRGKCNLYDYGTMVPLMIRWPGQPSGRVVQDFVNLMDLAPTFLEMAGAEIPDVMTGRSLVPVLKSEAEGLVDPERTWVVTGRERHVAAAREGNLPYPQRALRTQEHLLIRNFRPERWPMGSPGEVTPESIPSRDDLVNNTFIAFGDLDSSPTKAWIIENRDTPEGSQYYDWAFAKRPEFELYLLADDPDQLNNVAGDPSYAGALAELTERLMTELTETGDPRVTGDGMTFERSPFTDEWVRPKRN